MEITDREKELLWRFIQKLTLNDLCDALAAAYPTDKPNDTKNKAAEIINLMQRLKSADRGNEKNKL